MHVFTKLEFGEYVFLLLSRKIEISYKVKKNPAKQDSLSSVNVYNPETGSPLQDLL